MAQTKFPFEVFVSYSHKNEKWVADRLVPALKDAQIAFAWDRKDFILGKPFATEMLRLMRESRHTVVVLSRQWVASNFTEFEYQLSRALDPKAREGRVLVLRIDDCETPERLANLTAITVDTRDEDKAIGQLVDHVLDRRDEDADRPQMMLGADLQLWKSLRSDHFGGFQYEGQVTIGNPLGPSTRFDSILFRTHVPPDARDRLDTANALKILLTKRGRAVSWSYKEPIEFHTSKDAVPEVLILEPNHGLQLPGVSFGALRSSVAGHEPVICSVSLFLGKRQVSCESWCVLPPVARLPEAAIGPDRSQTRPGYDIHLQPETLMSAKSGLLDRDLLEQIFESAGRFAQDCLLLKVRPSMLTTHSFANGHKVHTATGWQYEFFSESRGGIFCIAPQDPSWVDPSSVKANSLKPECWLSENLLFNCWLDASHAYMIAVTTCPSVAESEFHFQLEVVDLENTWRPMWHVPRLYEGVTAGVLADTGELILVERQGLRKPAGVIWNL